ncbi:MAG: hypothetical protein JO263_06005 [Candidatus Eremiobacteraeota bacterium]|nr:hypothetical protein [Candidatus Eremiobacteraeota bacterium]
MKMHRCAALVAIAALSFAGCMSSGGSSAVPPGLQGDDVSPLFTGYKQLYAFSGKPSGWEPTGLTAAGKALYGTTLTGGSKNFGTVFARYHSGQVRILYSFRGGKDGAQPQGKLLLVGGTFYGTTEYGGRYGNGTVFAVTPLGKERVVYAFKGGKDGATPVLVGMVASKATLYGTTSAGGDTHCHVQNSAGCGTVFAVTTSGKEGIVHRFKGKSDGALPSGDLIWNANTLYGTTNFGGTTNSGTVFALSTNGRERVVYAFKGYPDGAVPLAGITALGGDFYGTTGFGGAFNYSGTVFKLTASGKEAVLYSFRGFPDGAVPYAKLVPSNGLLYGTTAYGGNATQPCIGGGVPGCGTVFSIDTSGTERILYRFGGKRDGANPWTGLVDSGGTFYATTVLGGPANAGTIFGFAP